MSDITPERLKGLAEAMGKEVRIEKDYFMDDPHKGEICYCVVEDPGYIYQPHKDWSQCGEVLEWLLGTKIGVSIDAARWLSKIAVLYLKYGDLKTAIVLAALAYVEHKQ